MLGRYFICGNLCPIRGRILRIIAQADSLTGFIKCKCNTGNSRFTGVP